MNYEDFFPLAYSNVLSFVVISSVLLFLMVYFLRRFVIGGILDPFHLYYSFTYSTSYAVIIMMMIEEKVDYFLSCLVFCYGLIFILTIAYLSLNRVSLGRFPSVLVNSFRCSHRAILIILFMYIFFVLVVVYSKGFSLFTSTNRFEDNKGVGPLVKFLYMATLFVIAYCSIRIMGVIGRCKRWLFRLILLIFMIFNAIISGAKSDMLVYFLIAVLAAAAYDKNNKPSVLAIASILIVSTVFAFVVLFFNFSSVLSADFPFTDLLGLIAERFMDRVFSNGDMYYMGLPNDIIDRISVDNFIIVLTTPLVSTSVMSNLAGYDVNMYDLGRQLLLYHYSNVSIAGGPTDHFDLFAYKYFGVFIGAIFVFLFSLYMYVLRTFLLNCSGNAFLCSMFSVIWVIGLECLMKPGLILGNLIFPLLFFIVVKLCDAMLSSFILKGFNKIQ